MLQVFAQQVAAGKTEKLGLTLSLGADDAERDADQPEHVLRPARGGSASDGSEPIPFMLGIRDVMRDEPEDVPEEINAYGNLHLSELRVSTDKVAVPTNTL